MHDIERTAARIAETTGADVGDLHGTIEPAIRSAERGVELARVVTAYARNAPTRIAVVDVGRVLDDAIELVRHSLCPRTRLVVRVAPGLPAVRASERELYQVFVNLLINAMKAVGDTAPEDEHAVHVDARRQSDMAEISIRDTGCGIAPEHLDRIFEPFFTTRPDSGGTGLGLPLCRRVVESAGGSLVVVTTVGAGSTFTVRLPPA
jgi:signal transduction histidine kinase